MIRVYFANGKEIYVEKATAVEAGSFLDVGEAPSIDAIVCRDAQGTVLARFRASELVGYNIEPEGSGTLRAA